MLVMKNRKNIKITWWLLTISAAMLFYGVLRGEAQVVLTKSINICLECIGIG